jgi:hypothetical protein
MGLLHLAQLRHRPVDALEPRLQQQPQGAGAAALLQGFPSGFQPGDLPLQRGLLLLQPAAGALLQGQGLHQLLHPPAPLLQGREQLLPLAVEGEERGGHALAALALPGQFLAQLRQPLLLLAEPLPQLLLLGLQGREPGLQLLATAAALLLLLQPAAAAAGHLPQPPAR